LEKKNKKIDFHFSEKCLHKNLRAEREEIARINSHTLLVIQYLNEKLGDNKRPSPVENKEVFAGRKG